ncbi:MAG: protein kinase [Candidatus Aureabacteria bacterium]|nr:protein kinase [Candidatus Auribacterota bacterium]
MNENDSALSMEDTTVQEGTEEVFFSKKNHLRFNDLKQDLEMYDVLSEIGEGATGIVYEAVHKKLGRPVAIKMLRPEYFKDHDILKNFRREAQIISRIKHENIASVYDFIEANKHYYIIMEKVYGKSLSDIIKTKRMTEEEILHVMLGLLEGVRYSHNKKILHLDIKPSNILINEYGEPVIVDFGISRFQFSNTEKNRIVGTPHYMAPEQYSRSQSCLDVRTDIYALGILFYQLVSGQLPFNGNSFSEIREKVMNHDPLRLSSICPDISPGLEAIILKMIRQSPSERYPDAQLVIDDIKRYLNNEPVKAYQYKRLSLVWNWMIRNMAVTVLSLLTLAVTFAFIVYFHNKVIEQTPQWKQAFSEDFNQDFLGKWEGYSGFVNGCLTPVKAEDFMKIFSRKIKVCGFKKEYDSLLLSNQSFNENVKLLFECTVNPNPLKGSHFGFFVNGSPSENEWGYLIDCQDSKMSLIRDNINSTPLWTGDYVFKSDQIYQIALEVINGHIHLFINNKLIFDFQDIVTWFSKNDNRIGFYATNVDMEVDNVVLFQQNTALLITPLDIGHRFFQLGRFDEAIHEYASVIEKYPAHKMTLDAYYFKGLALIKNNHPVKALRDFDRLISLTKEDSVKGKCYYQKGVCLLELNELPNACKSFDYALSVYDIASLRSNVINVVVDTALKKVAEATMGSVSDAEYLFQYLIKLNSPWKLSYVEVPKKIILYYFDRGYYEKCLQSLDLLIRHYTPKKDLLAFATWKKARAYSEMARLQKEEAATRSYNEKAIDCYNTILTRYPEIEIYCSFAHEELAKIYRSMGEFVLANTHEKQVKREWMEN